MKESESFGHWVVSDSCNPMNCSLPVSSFHGIIQERILEWITITFSRGSSWHRDWTWVSHIAGQFFAVKAAREALYLCIGYVYSKFLKIAQYRAEN